ncbi:MAG: bifunctional RNase H/acid phosphatase [Actinomycetes bacterium]
MSRHLIVEADGGSRGNPGPAGYGAVVRDAETGEVLRTAARSLGTTTNNVAEYEGLLAGLRAAVEIDAHAEVDVRMDSKLVVEQMSGNWKVKHEGLRPLAKEAAALIRALGTVRFSWIPREQNGAADRLANEAMDDAAAGRDWTPREPAASLAPTNRLPGWMSPPAPPTTTVLLRHGQTELSIGKRFSGRGDPQLTDLGLAQAEAAAQRLARRGDIAAVVSSPLSRARRTAEAVAGALELDITVDEDFAETDFGDWEGLTFAEVRERWPAEMAAWLADPAVAPPGGESFAATAKRALRGRDRVTAAHPAETVLIVSHVTPIKILTQDALQAPPSALYRLHVDLAAVAELDWYADGPAVLRLWNDTSHLAAR